MASYQFGPFELDVDAHLLTRSEEPVPLKPKVFLLLRHLVENPGRLISREELMDRLWPHQAIPDSNLTQSIYELRQALGDKRGPGQYVETVARRGFRFRIETPHRSGGDGAVLAADGTRITSLAVMPFAPLPGGERDEVLEFGISDTLITGLSRIPGLRVRQPSALTDGATLQRDNLSCGRALGVEAVLDGSLHRDGDRLRATARLRRVADEVILWADKFDQPCSDIFALEDAICERVVAAIATTTPLQPSASLLEPRASDPQVHELYLKCRYYWHKWTPEAWLRAIECGTQAIARDPGHAAAHTWTGASYCTLGIAGLQAPRDAFPRGAALIDRAIELNPRFGAAWECRGAIAHFFHWDFPSAEDCLRRAVELDPERVINRGLLAILLCITGRPDEGLRTVMRARELDPLSRVLNTGVGEVHFYRGELEQAAAAFERTLELDPFFVNARFLLGQVQVARGRHAEAVDTMRLAVGHCGVPPEASADLAYALAASGAHDQARAILHTLHDAATSRFVDPLGIALIHIGLGENDQALDWLDAAVEARSSTLIYIRAKANFDPLRGDPRFAALLRRIGI